MKAVFNLANRLGLEVKPIRFYFDKGGHRLGYSLYAQSSNFPTDGYYNRITVNRTSYPEILVIEPTGNNDKLWKVIHRKIDGNGLQFLKASQLDTIEIL